MKSGYWASKSALCPFYKCQNAQVIVCTGEENGSNLHYSFATPAQRKAFERAHCESCYKGCKGYQHHVQRIEEAEKIGET